MQKTKKFMSYPKKNQMEKVKSHISINLITELLLEKYMPSAKSRALYLDGTRSGKSGAV